MHIAAGEWRELKDRLKRAQELMAEGGDWERKNRLKVYEAIFLLATRDFKRAAQLFLDSIATFTSYVSIVLSKIPSYALLGTQPDSSIREKVTSTSHLLSSLLADHEGQL